MGMMPSFKVNSRYGYTRTTTGGQFAPLTVLNDVRTFWENRDEEFLLVVSQAKALLKQHQNDNVVELKKAA